MKTHNLKTWPEFFAAISADEKTFEIRLNDRQFEVGDTLILEEYDPSSNSYSGFKISRTITYVLHGGQFGIQQGWVVMGLSRV